MNINTKNRANGNAGNGAGNEIGGGKVRRAKVTEQELLRMLDIPDFRHMTKEKLVDFASTLADLDPEVAKKAIEQFPAFSSSVSGILGQYKSVLEKVMDDDNESTQRYFEQCGKIIDSLQSQLERDDLTAEERSCIIDKTIEVARMMDEKDSENKRFKFSIAAIFAAIAGVACIVLGVALGGKVSAPTSRR